MTAVPAILPSQERPNLANPTGRNHPLAVHVRPRLRTYLIGQSQSVSRLIGPHLLQTAPPAGRLTVAAKKVVARIANRFVMNQTIIKRQNNPPLTAQNGHRRMLRANRDRVHRAAIGPRARKATKNQAHARIALVQIARTFGIAKPGPNQTRWCTVFRP